MKEIELIQSPVIRYELQKVGEMIKTRIDDLNINNLVVTEETISSIKKLRSELNKEAFDFEEQRKILKKAILKPYDEFEAIYKDYVILKYKETDDELKNKITEYENKLRDDKRERLEKYFGEVLLASGIDFLKFDDVIKEIKLSVTEKSYQKYILEFISEVNLDLLNIKKHPLSTEILIEYKKSLNAGEAITTVILRKEEETRENEKLKSNNVTNISEPIEDIKKVRFECHGTQEALTGLGQYMRQNNIKYFNI